MWSQVGEKDSQQLQHNRLSSYYLLIEKMPMNNTLLLPMQIAANENFTKKKLQCCDIFQFSNVNQYIKPEKKLFIGCNIYNNNMNCQINMANWIFSNYKTFSL